MYRILLAALALSMLGFCAAAQSDYWQQVPSGTDKNLTSISFGNPQVGYIGGDDSLLLRSVDGGQSWHPLNRAGLRFSAATPDVIHVNFPSASTGYAIVGNRKRPVYTGTLYKTMDSGSTWAVIDSITLAAARSFFFDEQNGFVVGAQFFAGKTVLRLNQGRWDNTKLFSFDPSLFLKAIDFFDSTTGIVGGDGGQVYRTFDGGASWDTVQTVVDTAINALSFLNAHTIIAGSDDNGGALLISYDTGHTWQKDLSTLTFSYPALKDVAASRRDSFIAVGHVWAFPMGIILWMHQGFVYNFTAQQRLNAVAVRNDSVAYVVGDSGLILSNRETVLKVPGAKNPQWHVYPNPASGYCTVEAAMPVTLRLYDAAGHLVRSLDKPAQRQHLFLKGLAPGVYLLRAEGASQETFVQRLLVE